MKALAMSYTNRLYNLSIFKKNKESHCLATTFYQSEDNVFLLSVFGNSETQRGEQSDKFASNLNALAKQTMHIKQLIS